MGAVLPIPNILQIAQVSEYLAAVKSASNDATQGATLNRRLARLIYMERSAVQNRYNLNPSDSTLVDTGNYLFSILENQSKAQQIISNAGQSLPVITGPSNQSVNVGSNAVFTISVASSIPYTVQWYRNGVIIPGATGLSYTLANAQLSDSGSLFVAHALSNAGLSVSNLVTLTVTANLIAYYYYGSTDYSTHLLSGTDDVPYEGNFAVTTGQPLSFQWPSAAAVNQFIVVKYPATESTKSAYSNGVLNNGLIPSIAFNAVVVIGAWKYIFSRTGNTFSQDTTTPLIFS